MTSGMKDDWLKATNLYTDTQIAAVLQEIGVEEVSETDTVFMCYCPFHRNTDTPSFAVNKENGTYICFSPSCDVKGKLVSLVMQVSRLNIFQAKRLIEKNEGAKIPLEQQINDIFEKKNEMTSFPADKINEMSDAFWNSPAHEYMKGRGFTDKTMSYFQVGYSQSKGLVAVPVHDWEGNPVGVIGRTIEGKRFQNSKKIPTHKTLFNIHRAKKTGEKVIIVESSMDAMRLHQIGFPNVVATCGGFFTNSHAQLISRYFNQAIIMTDNDDPKEHISIHCKKCENTCMGHNPGRALGEKMIKELKWVRWKWAAYDEGIIYPHNAKDVGDMTDEEIIQCVNNAVSAAEMEIWKKDYPHLAMV